MNFDAVAFDIITLKVGIITCGNESRPSPEGIARQISQIASSNPPIKPIQFTQRSHRLFFYMVERIKI